MAFVARTNHGHWYVVENVTKDMIQQFPGMYKRIPDDLGQQLKQAYRVVNDIEDAIDSIK